MKAAQYDAFSDDITKIVVRDVPKPHPKAGEALIKVKAAAVNPIDWKVMGGSRVERGWRCDLPFTLGYDVSGTVVELGPETTTTSITIGDDVWCVNWGKGKHNDDDSNSQVGGTCAEYVALPLTKLSKKPSHLSHSHAAALALVGTTAYQMVDVSGVKTAAAAGAPRVLVLGGSTAVGTMAVQILLHRGARVVTTCSGRARSFVEALSPDRIIDYTEEDWADVLRSDPVEHVLDTVGVAGDFQKSAAVTKEGATFVSIAGLEVGFDPDAHKPHYSWASFLALSNSTDVQDELACLVSDGKLQVFIDSEVPFSQEGVLEVMRKQKAGKSLGKNVLIF
eukprot:CAMPEP_0172498716 /NCGR_PEP_ID=MMETSP1066-20121228/116319_1 /TAXON_ID=671091 /ORGANISM="Coscinodiscus wailesii, Strain CCMP2513" /LENGTH=335 /DNA_ID=CAMNT_0013272115 /DNA_START=85 /DNA_END=1092 /DNA_ORIENTATION=+